MTVVGVPTRIGARVLLGVLFALYLALLVWLVLWKLHEPFLGPDGARAVKLVPFVRTDTAGSSAPWELVGNVVVFVPFGIYLGALVGRRHWVAPILAVAASSAALEAAQYVLAVGITDVTDVLMNTLGGLLGLAGVRIALRDGRGRSDARGFLVCCLIATTFALAVAALIVVSWQRGVPAPRL